MSSRDVDGNKDASYDFIEIERRSEDAIGHDRGTIAVLPRNLLTPEHSGTCRQSPKDDA